MSRSVGPRSVLVAYDTEANRSFLCALARAAGAHVLLTATRLDTALDLVVNEKPEAIVMEWRLADGVDATFFSYRLRRLADEAARATPMLVCTANSTQLTVSAARACGIDGYVARPVSQAAFSARMGAIIATRRAFVVSASYVGPCRRRDPDPAYAGPRRRLNDPLEYTHIDPADDPRIARVREALDRLNERLLAFAPNDRNAARLLFDGCAEVRQTAIALNDPPLREGADALCAYVEAAGATPALEPRVIAAHVDALQHIIGLTPDKTLERAEIARSVSVMSSRKVRQLAFKG